ncbi:MAG TPA: ATP-binding protein [Anaerolineae bacterium]|nr:ATP-binding protein [Anaerolineae bacterium]
MNGDEAVELIQSIRAGRYEETAIEVKAAHNALPARLSETLSALANRSGGGVIVLGLDEQRSFAVVGVANVQSAQSNLANMASEMEPALRLDCTVVSVEGKHCLVVEVPECALDQRPCHNKQAGLQKGSYTRVGNTNRRMTDYEIFGYISNRSQPQFDRQPIAEAGLADLDTVAVESYMSKLKVARPNLWQRLHMEDMLLPDQLCATDIAARENGTLRPTLAGLLCFGVWPQRLLPSLMLTFVRYPGTTTDERGPRRQRFLDSARFDGPLPQVVEDAVRRVAANMQQSTLVEGIFHRTLPEYPEEAIREAVVNAVAHRDYSPMARGSQIRVQMFADRLEVQSPGGLFGAVNEENLEDAQSTRNQLLVRFLEELGMVENRGSGIRAMLAAMREAHLEPPRFVDGRSFFQVTFRNVSLMRPEAVKWLNQFGGYPLSDNQRMALVYLRNNGQMTNSDYRRLNNVADTIQATRELKKMVDQGLIEMHATRRWATYSLATSISEESGTPASAAREREVLQYVREQGSISSGECQKLLAITPTQARYLLGQMRERGLLARTGAVRWTRYTLSHKSIDKSPQ